jgi:two-component system, response regulator YesN
MNRFLVVDDEKIERGGIKMLIAKLNLPVIVNEAENGEAALAKLREDDYAILFTDIKMPFMDGLTLAHEAKLIRPNIQIIIFSAYGDFSKAQKAIDENVFSYLLKPVDIRRFNETVMNCVKRLDTLQASREQIEALEMNNRRHKVVESRLLSVLHPDTLLKVKEDLLSALEESPERAEAPDAAAGKNRTIGIVLEIIRRDYKMDLSLESIADKVHLTPGYLSTFFRKHTGENLVKYINNFRLDIAAEQLCKTSKRIAEIAADVGMANNSYFTTQFRQRFLVTPAQYRDRTSGRTSL